MFRNRYNVRCHSPHLLWSFHATRAVSGRSVPILAFAAAGAGALIRLLGPKSIGGLGDFGARIDAEAARTGMTSEEIGEKVYIYLCRISRWN